MVSAYLWTAAMKVALSVLDSSLPPSMLKERICVLDFFSGCLPENALTILDHNPIIDASKKAMPPLSCPKYMGRIKETKKRTVFARPL